MPYSNDIAQYNPMLNPYLQRLYNQNPQQVIQQPQQQAMGPQPMPSAGGLLPQLIQKMMGNSPSQLLQKQQQFQAQQQGVLNQQQMAMLKESYAQYDALLKNENLRNLAKEHGITPEEFIAKVNPLLSQKAAMATQMGIDAMKAPGAQESVNKNFQDIQAKPGIENRVLGTVNVPQGGTSFIPNGSGGYNIAQGSLQRQGTTLDAYGRVVPLVENAPGRMGSFDGDPAVRARVLGGNTDLSLSPSPTPEAQNGWGFGNMPGAGLPLNPGNISIGGQNLGDIQKWKFPAPTGPLMDPRLSINGINNITPVPAQPYVSPATPTSMINPLVMNPQPNQQQSPYPMMPPNNAMFGMQNPLSIFGQQ